MSDNSAAGQMFVSIQADATITNVITEHSDDGIPVNVLLYNRPLNTEIMSETGKKLGTAVCFYRVRLLFCDSRHRICSRSIVKRCHGRVNSNKRFGYFIYRESKNFLGKQFLFAVVNAADGESFQVTSL